MSAVAAQTRGLLLSGLAAGLTATAVSVPAFVFLPFAGKLLASQVPGPWWTAVLDAVFGFVLPLASAWAGLKARHAWRPFAVAHPENAMVGLVWGFFVGMVFFGVFPWFGLTGLFSFGAAGSTLTALVPRKILLPGLFFSPLPLLIQHILTEPMRFLP